MLRQRRQCRRLGGGRYDGRIVREEFCKWYLTTSNILEARQKAAQDAQENDALEIQWPAEGNAAAKAMFVVTLPLVLLFSYSMPDVRRPGKFALGGLYKARRCAVC